MARRYQAEQLVGSVASDPELVRCHTETCSTMSVARQLVEAYQGQHPYWGVALAETQTQGRGRLDRVWVSLKGNLLATFIISLSSRTVTELAGLSLVVGCSVVSFLRPEGLELFLKWPNDILSQAGGKLGGILVEIVPCGSGYAALIGLGLNLKHAPPEGAAFTDVSECLSPELTSPEACVLGLLPILRRDVARFESSGFAVFREQWLQHSRVGADILVSIENKKVPVKYLGISEAGALIVNYQGRVVQITSGEIVDTADECDVGSAR